MRAYTLFIIVVLTSYAQTSLACKSDMDCKGQRICQASQCINPDAAASPTRAAASPASSTSDGKSSISINALGPLQLGIGPTWEWGEDVTTVFRLRFLNTGLLSYVISSLQGETFYGGLGVGLGSHIFLKGQGSQTGFYIGAMAEYILSVTDDDQLYITHYVAPQIELGYRTPDEEGFTGFGLFVGVGVPVIANYDDTESIIVGGLSWEQGWWQD